MNRNKEPLTHRVPIDASGTALLVVVRRDVRVHGSDDNEGELDCDGDNDRGSAEIRGDEEVSDEENGSGDGSGSSDEGIQGDLVTVRDGDEKCCPRNGGGVVDSLYASEGHPLMNGRNLGGAEGQRDILERFTVHAIAVCDYDAQVARLASRNSTVHALHAGETGGQEGHGWACPGCDPRPTRRSNKIYAQCGNIARDRLTEHYPQISAAQASFTIICQSNLAGPSDTRTRKGDITSLDVGLQHTSCRECIGLASAKFEVLPYQSMTGGGPGVRTNTSATRECREQKSAAGTGLSSWSGVAHNQIAFLLLRRNPQDAVVQPVSHVIVVCRTRPKHPMSFLVRRDMGPGMPVLLARKDQPNWLPFERVLDRLESPQESRLAVFEPHFLLGGGNAGPMWTPNMAIDEQTLRDCLKHLLTLCHAENPRDWADTFCDEIKGWVHDYGFNTHVVLTRHIRKTPPS
ncbi:hypothetical protein K488DRAFT_75001 [Vararia minispora EC-137]|uniref:Uncharacterized protein n=1 Tax=Vararia minispora EC-137 TaxID=1314806 RepID=A0ACB8Q5D0_9AGAM|nr:hypothetical protein K488DRAFT_75001 [Vararia minispora EC-137]